MSIQQTVYRGGQKAVALSAVCAAMALSAMSAQANTITSNDPDCTGNPIARVFSVTAMTVVKCLAKGTGNINGNNDAFQTSSAGASYTFLDASDTADGAKNGSLSGDPPLIAGLAGTFSILPNVYTFYKDIAIGFKVGEGQADPDWAIFQLAANTLTGSWSVTGNQALSHAILYGKLCAPTDNCGGGGANGNGGGVPEPASLALVGLGLLGAATARRRQRT